MNRHNLHVYQNYEFYRKTGTILYVKQIMNINISKCTGAYSSKKYIAFDKFKEIFCTASACDCLICEFDSLKDATNKYTDPAQIFNKKFWLKFEKNY